jgi:excisionase family DNA binding protein
VREYLSLKEAAEVAGYSYFHFRHMVIDHGMLPYYRPGGPRSNIRIRRDELEAWIDKAISTPGDPRITRNLHPKVRKAISRFTSFFSHASLHEPVNRGGLRRSGRPKKHGASATKKGQVEGGRLKAEGGEE